MVFDAQWQVLDQIRKGTTVQSPTGEDLDFRPMKPDWSTVTDLVLAGKIPRNAAGETQVDAMRRAVICTNNPDSFSPSVQMQRAELRAELCGEGEEDESGLQRVISLEKETVSYRSRLRTGFRLRGVG